MKPSISLRAALAVALALVAAPSAFAAGTAAGTNVSNSASVDYTVGGVNQTDVVSNTVVFEVDRRLNMTVARLGGVYIDSVPGSTDQVLRFTVTNTSNSPQDFRLSAAQDPLTTADDFGGTDDFEVTGLTVFVDANGNGTYDAGIDTATFIDELAADGMRTVFVVADIPSTATNLQTAGITLTATAGQDTDGSGNYVATVGTPASDSVETNTLAADDPTFVDTVFGDGAGDTDLAQDGQHSDDHAYRVITATISVFKTSRVVSDPFNGTTNPKAIPGAIIEYCIQVSNAGGTAADNVVMTDTVPANTTFVSGSIFTNGTVTAGACNADGDAEDDDATGANETDPNGGHIAAGAVVTTTSSIAAGTTRASRFRVTIVN